MFSTIARHTTLAQTWLPFCLKVLYDSEFTEQEREAVILRVAWHCGFDYEWAHHARLASRIGMSDDLVAALARPGLSDFTGRTALLLTATDELLTERTVCNATWAELAQQCTEEQLIELPMLVGQYQMLGQVLNALNVQIDRPDLPALGEVYRSTRSAQQPATTPDQTSQNGER